MNATSVAGNVGSRVPDVRKIAVLRANGLGDFIFALPALAALRRTHPDAEIVLLGKRWHADALDGRPGPIDRVVVVPPSRGVSESNDFEENQAEMDAFFRSMAQERFDLALQMQGGGAFSNPFVRRLGARVTAGLQSGNAVPLDRNVPYIYFQPEIMRSLEVVALVGAYPAGLEPCFPITDEDVRESLSAVARVENLVALHPGVGHPGRQWPAVRFAATGDALAREGATVIVVGGAGEKDLGACVVEHMEAASVNAAGRLSLGGLAGLFSRCRVVVSNDSGPLHLACAVGAATVGIYWCFNLYTAGPLTRTRHRPVVSWRIRCPVCDRDQTQDPCVHRASYVADIPVEHVVQAALDLLRQEGTRYRRRVERGFW